MDKNRNKKVWILTIRAGTNFGSSLQAYAMQRVFNKLGFENEIINYDEYYHNIRWRIRPFIEDALYFLMNKLPKLSTFIAAKSYTYLMLRKVQLDKFYVFEKTNIILTKREFKTSKSIERNLVNVDICVCGSDQIWNPFLFDSAFYLDFCHNQEIKTIAYAPSFGISQIIQREDQIKKLINTIDFISVREDSGSKLIKEITGRNAPVVLDPTLLLEREDWEEISSTINILQKPYILCYFLGKTYLPNSFIDSLQCETNYEVVNICTYRTLNSIQGEKIVTASPDEFLSYVANAAYVCTDSYHATIFSIIFERQFFTFERFKDGADNQNTRIYSLLSKVDLLQRLVDYDSVYLNNQSVVFEDCKMHLQNMKNESYDFLKSSLNS